MQKFLIIQTAFIGDVVLATGLIEKIHQHYPDAHIDFLLRKGNEGLLQNHPLLHELLVWDKKKNKFAHLLQMIGRVRRKKYDVLINVQRFAATGLLTALSGAKRKIGFDKNPFSFLFSTAIPHQISGNGQSLHEIERNHWLIRDFTDKEPALPTLYPADSDFVRVQEYKETPYLCISPASVWFTKQYPAEKWMALLSALPPNYRVYLLGAPGDKALAEQIRLGTSHANVINLCGKLSFLQSAALMRDAVMNFVNDSAPMHFASAMNAPVA
ncbi:MAG TPA: glycosyltransferase family 9 protein, partial [Chitinophagaceae bacterium]|nr:glycosyltransferase family 9 protein [Chitinophagaceae bacterium]